MRLSRAALAAALLVCAATAAAAQSRPDARLDALLEREYRYQLEEFPEQATMQGVPGFDDRLRERSPEAVARRRAHVAAYARELAAFDASTLSVQDRLSRDMELERARRTQAFERIYGDLPFDGDPTSWEPVSPMHGPQHDLAALAKATRLTTPADYGNYLKRLAAVPRALEQITQRMRAAQRAGWMPPAQAMTQVVAQFAPFADGPIEATPLGKPFRDFPVDVAPADRARLSQAGTAVLHDKVQPAFRRMRDFLANEYLPAARKTLGASDLPGGARFYELLVESATTTHLKPREIHETGLREVARIGAEMAKAMEASGFKGTMPEFLEFLRTDPRFFFKTPEERLRAYRDIAKRADAELPKLFAVLPRLPYGVRAMEDRKSVV